MRRHRARALGGGLREAHVEERAAEIAARSRLDEGYAVGRIGAEARAVGELLRVEADGEAYLVQAGLGVGLGVGVGLRFA